MSLMYNVTVMPMYQVTFNREEQEVVCTTYPCTVLVDAETPEHAKEIVFGSDEEDPCSDDMIKLGMPLDREFLENVEDMTPQIDQASIKVVLLEDAPPPSPLLKVAAKAFGYDGLDDDRDSLQTFLRETVEGAEDKDELVQSLEQLRDDCDKAIEALSNLCGKCGEPADNGEGYDGLCGNCADKTL